MQQSFNEGKVQPGIIVIRTYEYININQLAMKIQTGCMGESIVLLFASYHVFNLSFNESFSLINKSFINSFLVAMMETNNKYFLEEKKSFKICSSQYIAVNKILPIYEISNVGINFNFNKPMKVEWFKPWFTKYTNSLLR